MFKSHTFKNPVSVSLFILYVAFVAFGLWRHEMWRDEHQAWNLVLESKSITDIFTHIRYEGHPSLWFLLLWPFSWITHSVYVIQFVNLALCLLVAYLVVFKSPFALWEKILILFSYFILYEYAIVSRNYMIGVVLLFAIASLFNHFRKNLLPISLLLFLLFQTNAFMALIAAALLGTILVKLYQERLVFSPKGIITILLGGLGAICFYLTTKPPADNSYAAGWNFSIDTNYLVAVIGTSFKGLFPIPSFPVYYWNNNFSTNASLNAAMALICFTIFFWVFRKDKTTSLFLLFAFGLLLFFMYVKFIGHPRHHGHFAIILLFAYWISKASQKVSSIQQKIVFAIIFSLQSLAGVLYSYTDWKHPFSMGKKVAQYIQANFPEDVQLAGAYNDLSTSVCGYLGRKALLLNDGRYSNYVLWKNEFWNRSNYALSDSLLFQRFSNKADLSKSNLVIMAYRTEEARQKNALDEGESRVITLADGSYKVTCLKTFSGALCMDENYLLYQLAKL